MDYTDLSEERQEIFMDVIDTSTGHLAYVEAYICTMDSSLDDMIESSLDEAIRSLLETTADALYKGSTELYELTLSTIMEGLILGKHSDPCNVIGKVFRTYGEPEYGSASIKNYIKEVTELYLAKKIENEVNLKYNAEYF